MRPFVAASFLGRLSFGVLPLALVLMLRTDTGSYATAGAVIGAYGLGSLSAPAKAALVDRRGPMVGLIPFGLACAALLLGLVLAASLHANAVVLIGLSLVAAVCTPPLGPVSRTLWAGMTSPEETATAWSLDLVGEEIILTLGPLITAFFVATSSASAAVVFAIVLVVVGTVAISVSPAWRRPVNRPPVTEDQGPRSPPKSLRRVLTADLVALLVSLGCVGVASGALFIAVPALETLRHSPASSGVLLAVWSAGSVVGSALFGRIQWRQAPRSLFVGLSVAMAVSLAVAAATATTIELAVVLASSGMVLGPSLICAYLVADDHDSHGLRSTVNALVGSSYNLGDAIGASAAGAAVVVWGPTSVLAASATIVVLGAFLITFIGRPSTRAQTNGAG